MLLSCLLVLVGNDEVVHHMFLQKVRNVRNDRINFTYDCGLLLIEVTLMLLDALFATEEDKTIAKVVGHFSVASNSAIESWDVVVTMCI